MCSIFPNSSFSNVCNIKIIAVKSLGGDPNQMIDFLLFICDNKTNISLFLTDHPVHAPASRGDPWECEFPPSKNYKISPINGVFNLFASEEDCAVRKCVPYSYPDLATFVRDMNLLSAMMADGPLKSFCYRRLSYLSSKFQLHVLLNELRELASQKAVPHRDFYNIRKVRLIPFLIRLTSDFFFFF